MFASQTNFKIVIRKIYRDVNIQVKVIRKIEGLKIKNYNIQTYTSNFYQAKAKVDINDDNALKRYYYNSLAENIKDELSKVLKLQTLLELIDMATAINSRSYKRHQERKGIISY